MQKFIISYKKGGDNPSDFEIDDYRKTLRKSPNQDRIISSSIALNCIRAEMKLGTMDVNLFELHIHEDDGSTIRECNFIKTDISILWADKTWTEACKDINLYAPTSKELESDLNLMLELL